MADFTDVGLCTKKDWNEAGTFNTLGITVATTGYMGGDSGHGGRTYLSIEDLDCSDLDARVVVSDTGSTKVELMLGGDSELDSLIESLRWAADALEKMAR